MKEVPSMEGFHIVIICDADPLVAIAQADVAGWYAQ